MILNLSDILPRSILIPGKDLPAMSKEELHEKGIEELTKYLKKEFRNPVITCTPIQGIQKIAGDHRKMKVKKRK